MSKRKKFERRQKTLADLKDIPGEIWYMPDTGVTIYMESDAPAYALGELLQKFYQANEGLSPIAFKLEEDQAASISEKLWYAIMYRSWHIRIVRGRTTDGPHQTQLWFKSESMRKNFWIATLQLSAFYFNETEMRDALLSAIANKEFYISDEERDKIITV